MAKILLSTLMDALGGPVPVDAVLTFTATRSRASGAVVVANGTVTVRIVAGVPTEDVDLVPSGVDWAYKATLSVSSIGRRIDRTVAVPDVPSVEWADLVDVDPATLLPAESAVPAWTAAVGQVAAVLADTETARDGAVTAQGLSESARDAAVLARGIAEIARDGAVVAQGASEDARDQAQVYAANTVELQDTTFTALIADPESATRTQLNATMGTYLDVNVPGEVSGALTSDPVVQAGVDAAIDTGLPPAIAAVLPGAVATEVTTQVTPHVTAAAGSATAAQTARAGAEAARNLALAGQFAGSDLGTANLNTITTPGVYRQGTTANATLVLNYPVASVQGVLEVFHSTATSSIFQRYMQTTGTASGKGHWQRRYTSSAWSAWGFVATQRVDQSAGRVIYAWDDVNNREQLIYGDTGWLDITASVGSVVTGGSVFVRRYGATVFIALSGVTVPIAGTVNGALPIGFRIAHAVALPTPYGSITTWDTNGSLAFSALGTGRYAGVSFPTSNAWPTTLPGTPVGSIPNA